MVITRERIILYTNYSTLTRLMFSHDVPVLPVCVCTRRSECHDDHRQKDAANSHHATILMTMRWPIILLLCADIVFLFVTFGLQIWALNVLIVSCQHANDVIDVGYQNVPFAQAYTATETQTGTGYASTSTRPPTTSAIRTSTYTLIETDGKKYPTTQFDIVTFNTQLLGYTPTATTTRTVTVTGLRDVRAGGLLDSYYVAASRPTVTPLARRAQGGASIYYYNMLTPDTSFNINDYRAVTVNHGFGKHFAEAGLNYDYFDQANGGYSKSDRARIIGLTTLMALALCASLLRLVVTMVCTASMYRRKDKGTGVHRRRWPLYANIVAAFLLCGTCVAFWTIYGQWTHRSAAVEYAYEAFRQQQDLVWLRIDRLFDTRPWRGTPTALVVFWCLSCVTSIGVCVLLGKM